MAGRRRGRPVLGGVAGLVTGVLVSLDLFLLGLVRLDNPFMNLPPLVGLLSGVALGVWAPIPRRRRTPAGGSPVAAQGDARRT